MWFVRTIREGEEEGHPINVARPWKVVRVRWRCGPICRVTKRREVGHAWSSERILWLGHETKRGWAIDI